MTPIEKPPVTLKLADIARLAGVSVATASRALSRPEMVSKQTREVVQAAATSAGYRPNLLARSLRMQSSQMVLVLLRECNFSIYSEILRGLDWKAQESGFSIMLGITGHDDSRLRSYLENARRQRASGLIAFDGLLGHLGDDVLGKLPSVQILDRFEGANAPSVVVDCSAAVATAISHLYDLGHRKIGFMDKSQNMDVYRPILQAHGMAFDPALFISDGSGFESGVIGMRKLMESPSPPTAVVCRDSHAARGVLCWSNLMNLNIPEKLSVLSLGDETNVAKTDPPLTTIPLPSFELGVTAFSTLQEVIAGHQQPPLQVLMPGPLEFLGSTAAPPAPRLA